MTDNLVLAVGWEFSKGRAEPLVVLYLVSSQA